ncbi:hypothetical protein TNCT_558091 [Trichonephila clavata]|uniref:Uncharacterized protein n=1 Tax=Trichonephila clavata TaxID=2740835 RepID=A0A8X6LKN8_TRICU|nr:hypothetical protein TNCT_558091 [Trichonephila clavata]
MTTPDFDSNEELSLEIYSDLPPPQPLINTSWCYSITFSTRELIETSSLVPTLVKLKVILFKDEKESKWN